jgi:hypothetical protein
MKKLKKVPGACAVIALRYVLGIDEDAVLRVCKLYGFTERSGMEDKDWQSAAKHLSIIFRAVALPQCTLKQFVKNHPEGLYLVGTHDHLFCVDSGVVVDPRTPTPGLKRIIKQAWKVEK